MSSTNVEICSNCGRVILRSEQAYLVRGKIVCAECDKLLRSEQTPQPTPSPEPFPEARKGIMKSEMRKFTPAIYVLTLICFFLPFVHLSCQGERVASFTGIQLVTGTTINQPQMFGRTSEKQVAEKPKEEIENPIEKVLRAPTVENEVAIKQVEKKQAVTGPTEKIAPEPLAILLLCTAVVGFVGSFLKGRNGTIAPIIAGVIGLIFLLLLKAKIDNDVFKREEGMLQVEYAVGFWLMLVSFLGAVAINAFSYYSNEKMRGIERRSLW